MIIPVSDLLSINTIAKALKQKEFVWHGATLYGIDAMGGALIMAIVPPTTLLSLPLQYAFHINQRELSLFCGQISTETECEFNPSDMNGKYVASIREHEFNITCNVQIHNMALTMQSSMQRLTNELNGFEEFDATDLLQSLVGRTKSSGAIPVIYDKSHIMYLFSSALPLTKADRVLLTIKDYPNGTFLCRFRVPKKHCTIQTFMSFIRI